MRAEFNNVSGSVTPNALLTGFFVYNIVGPTTINMPTNISQGQVFYIRLNNAEALDEVTWAAGYTGSLSNYVSEYATQFLYEDGKCLLMCSAST